MPRLFLLAGIGGAAGFWLVEAVVHSLVFGEGPLWKTLRPEDPNEQWMRSLLCAIILALGVFGHLVATRWARLEKEVEQLRLAREQALTSTLATFVNMCMHCKCIRRSDDQWERLEAYLSRQASVRVSHGLCPTCYEKHYGRL